jgi:predicted ATPase
MSAILKKVVLKNFKSIESCDIELRPMTLLVGPNGAGKSNFVDSVRLTSDALQSTLENALRERGGVNEVRRRSRGHPTNFGVRLELVTPEGFGVNYAYQVAARPNQSFEVQREECRVWRDGIQQSWYQVHNGKLETSVDEVSNLKLSPNALALNVLSSVEQFASARAAIASFGFYSFNLQKVRDLQNPDAGITLSRDGGNLASVIRRMQSQDPKALARVVEYLAAVVPGTRGVGPRTFGPMETVEFRQDVSGEGPPWKYLAGSVSDGTLRALCVLIAVFQSPSVDPQVKFSAIEEPETAIHPGAALRLMDGLLEASATRQLLMTTHSPDLLDHSGIDIESVVAVQSDHGTSRLGPVEESTREAVRGNLYTVGELLRLEQVRPELFPVTPTSAKLF